MVASWDTYDRLERILRQSPFPEWEPLAHSGSVGWALTAYGGWRSPVYGTGEPSSIGLHWWDDTTTQPQRCRGYRQLRRYLFRRGYRLQLAEDDGPVLLVRGVPAV